MLLPVKSQITQPVIKVISINSDTLLQTPLDISVILLGGALQNEVCDSTLKVFERQHKQDWKIIHVQNTAIGTLQAKCENDSELIANNKTERKNDSLDYQQQLKDKDTTIGKQKITIIRQKVYKWIAGIGDIALPIAAIYLYEKK